MANFLPISVLLALSTALLAFWPAHAAAYKGCKSGPSSKLLVNVKSRGAKGDGRADDTKAIQRAIDEVAGTGGTVYLPPGTYRVQAVSSSHLILKSSMTFKMTNKTTLKMFPTDKKHYKILRMKDAEDVTVTGGTILGDRRTHKGRGGEWGYGIFIGPNSKRITIANVRSLNMWGDGFNVVGGTDVAFCSVHARNNRRQGLSIIRGSRILVTNSVFRDTGGTRPGAGIDLEPDKPAHQISKVRIERSKFFNNDGGGIMIAGKKGRISQIRIQRNEFDGAQPLLIEYAPRVAESQICNNRYKPLKRFDKNVFVKVSKPRHVIGLQKPCRGKARRPLW